MLEAMEKSKVALCEAEVGTGRTYVYLLAVVAYRLFHTGRMQLPFPIPDLVLEYEKSLYEDFFSFLSESIIPSMLMKLRQWIGREGFVKRRIPLCSRS